MSQKPPAPQTIARANALSETLSRELRARISSGELSTGARLPTEKALAEAYGVSRAVVREAIAQLKADGLVETRQGSGSFVARTAKSLNLRFWGHAEPALTQMQEIFELRAMVEGAVAELAARRRNAQDIVTIASYLDAMDEALATGCDGTLSDDGFHVAIAGATHNGYVNRLVEFLGRHFSESRKLAWPDTAGVDELPRAAQREHRALFNAIAAGRAPLARRRALKHLRAAAGRVGITLAVDLD